MPQAVDAYTKGGAYARFADDRIGTLLDIGKEATWPYFLRMSSAFPERSAKPAWL